MSLRKQDKPYTKPYGEEAIPASIGSWQCHEIRLQEHCLATHLQKTAPLQRVVPSALLAQAGVMSLHVVPVVEDSHIDTLSAHTVGW